MFIRTLQPKALRMPLGNHAFPLGEKANEVDATRDARLAGATERTVSQAVRRPSRVPDLRRRIKAEQIRIVGTLYERHTGAVRVLTPSEKEGAPQ